jgi:predicted secreted protein
MSRLTKFLVTLNGEVHEADTAKEVSRLLGRKVTRAQIIACMVPEVQLLEDKSEDSNNTDTIKSDEGDVNMEVNESIQEQVEEVLNGGTEVTSEDEQTIADLVSDIEEVHKAIS